MLVSIIIPVYNEENFIKELLIRISKINNIDKEIIVINDKSSDRTKNILENECNFLYSKLIHNERNMGKGYSCRKGILEAKGEIIIKKKIIKCRRYDDLKLKSIPHFIKIDTEVYDEFVLKGLKKTINKYKPIFLVEYNKEYYNNVKKILKDYVPYFYDVAKNKMIKIPKLINKEKIARTTKSNYLSVRNIYFIPFNKKIN